MLFKQCKTLFSCSWKWSYDGTEIVQKDYPLWEQEGGPDNTGLACSAINPADNYKVKPVDCSGPKIPLICMMKEGDRKCNN